MTKAILAAAAAVVATVVSFAPVAIAVAPTHAAHIMAASDAGVARA